ncbi:protein kinase domain-containing protein [Ktedonosporobacter rubrisoli]|nr:ABC transporter substrate-binding protein [Ktedonosporobacter rubrisoli]
MASAALSSTESSAITSRSLVPGSRLQGGRYVIKKVLGQGGMGAALLATDNRLDGKPVVIKELISENTDPARFQEDVRNFKREVALLAHIDHPLVPSVTDHFQEGTRYFMVQEYVEGENLEERLTQHNQPLKEREVLICASEILDILDYLAQQTPPIVHRDIKPANIIIGSRDRRAHLVDFGIARAEATRNAQRKQTSALGTPGFAPPEQYQGNADPRSDLYALAATIHYLVTNRDPRNYPPFSYPPVRTLNAQLSPETEQVLTRALLNDILQRYQSASAMKQDVDEILRRRFGISGNIDSYVLGVSGPMASITNPTISSAESPTGGSGAVIAASTMPDPLTPLPGSGPIPTLTAAASTPSSLTPTPSGLNPIVGMTQTGQRRTRSKYILPILLAALIIVGGGGAFALFSFLRAPRGSGSTENAAATAAGGANNGIGVTKVGNDYIGISDGSFSFDTNRADGSLKLQAAQSFKKGDISSAVSLWHQAVAEDSNDAEALIYLENQHIAAFPHITIVVGTMLSGDSGSVGTGRDNLQGAYVAQKEFNDGSKLPGGLKVRLLIASSGSQTDYVKQVAEQVVHLAQSDPTFVGVMGWPYSSRSVEALSLLGAAHIPMVSQTSSSDELSGVSPYFFRVVPSNTIQGIQGAKYAELSLHAKKVAVFVDIKDPYSQSLAQDFTRQFQKDGNTVVATEQYTIGKTDQLPALLQDALSHSPDLIYFSGYASDVSPLLINLPAGNLPVMGGDALYQLNGYPSSARAGFSHLRFTAFAYPDEWSALGLEARKPAFFSAYPAAFDPNSTHQGSPYGFTRADNDAMLSYDAMTAVLTGCSIALSSGKKSITPSDLQQALKQVNVNNAIQGVSGRIAFGPDGDPLDKAIVILYVSPEGYIKMEPTTLGRFLK